MQFQAENRNILAHFMRGGGLLWQFFLNRRELKSKHCHDNNYQIGG